MRFCNGVGRATHRGKRLTRFRKQRLPSRGQGYTLWAPDEKFATELSFEGPDRHREAGLHDMSPSSGFRETLFLGNRYEMFELSQFHQGTCHLGCMTVRVLDSSGKDEE